MAKKGRRREEWRKGANEVKRSVERERMEEGGVKRLGRRRKVPRKGK